MHVIAGIAAIVGIVHISGSVLCGHFGAKHIRVLRAVGSSTRICTRAVERKGIKYKIPFEFGTAHCSPSRPITRKTKWFRMIFDAVMGRRSRSALEYSFRVAAVCWVLSRTFFDGTCQGHSQAFAVLAIAFHINHLPQRLSTRTEWQINNILIHLSSRINSCYHICLSWLKKKNSVRIDSPNSRPIPEIGRLRFRLFLAKSFAIIANWT